jgi:hypothetical protein
VIFCWSSGSEGSDTARAERRELAGAGDGLFLCCLLAGVVAATDEDKCLLVPLQGKLGGTLSQIFSEHLNTCDDGKLYSPSQVTSRPSSGCRQSLLQRGI